MVAYIFLVYQALVFPLNFMISACNLLNQARIHSLKK